jgi:hypothetical protein
VNGVEGIVIMDVVESDCDENDGGEGKRARGQEGKRARGRY